MQGQPRLLQRYLGSKSQQLCTIQAVKASLTHASWTLLVRRDKIDAKSNFGCTLT